MIRPFLASMFLAPLALGLLGSQAMAAMMDHHHHHATHAVEALAGHATGGAETSATKAYKQAMQTMHAQMPKASGNPDVDFVRQMIPHHQAAVDMARAQLAYGKNEALKSFSRWVIYAQEIEIQYMQQWLRGHDNGAASSSATDHYGEVMQKMHHAMMIDYTGDADRDFVRAMIPHHQGAMDMASIVIAQGVNPEIRTLANDIYRAQTYEVAWQRDWLADPEGTSRFPTPLR